MDKDSTNLIIRGFNMPVNPSIQYALEGDKVRRYNQDQDLRDATYQNQMADYADQDQVRPLAIQARVGELRNRVGALPMQGELQRSELLNDINTAPDRFKERQLRRDGALRTLPYTNQLDEINARENLANSSVRND